MFALVLLTVQQSDKTLYGLRLFVAKIHGFALHFSASFIIHQPCLFFEEKKYTKIFLKLSNKNASCHCYVCQVWGCRLDEKWNYDNVVLKCLGLGCPHKNTTVAFKDFLTLEPTLKNIL